MRNILLRLSYDGTHFKGWQRQKNFRTVQEEIEKELSYIHKEPISLHGSGRTDSGVHATGQAAHFLSPIDSIPIKNYLPALNSRLPQDIRIHSAEERPLDFHARFSAVSRTYRYYFYCGSCPAAYEMPYVYPLYRSPDIKKLNKMASFLSGEIDCSSFSVAGDKSLSKSRYIEKAVFFIEGNKLVFEICANAFLWKMVRSITGTLIGLEAKNAMPAEFYEILKAKDRSAAGLTAPPQGLFLWNVEFTGKRIQTCSMNAGGIKIGG